MKVQGTYVFKKISMKNVLFLEDDEELSLMMIPIFKVFVKEVFSVQTIQQAKEVFLNNTVDIIISDIHLKNENGLDFIRDIRLKNEKIPIVVLSGYKDESTLFKAIPLGLTGYLLKPVTYTQLVDIFEKCMHKISLYTEHSIKLSNGFEYLVNEKKLVKNGLKFDLNKKEILFMELLCNNKNLLITKDLIQYTVWESLDMSDSALYNFILRIRHRFGKDFIHAISNLGYRLGES
jgi:DNA-binding response OmpR family regulator